MIHPDKLKNLYGRVIFRDSKGKVLASSKNIWLRQGYDYIGKKLTTDSVENSAVYSTGINSVRIGNADRPATFNQTSLFGDITVLLSINGVAYDTTDPDVATAIASFTVPAGTPLVGSVLAEVGLVSLFNVTSNEILVSRLVLDTPIPIDATTSLLGTYIVSTAPIEPPEPESGIFDLTFDETFN